MGQSHISHEPMKLVWSRQIAVIIGGLRLNREAFRFVEL